MLCSVSIKNVEEFPHPKIPTVVLVKNNVFHFSIPTKFWHLVESKSHFYYIKVLMKQYKVFQWCSIEPLRLVIFILKHSKIIIDILCNRL